MINNKHVKILLAHPKLLGNGNNVTVKLNNDVFLFIIMRNCEISHKQPVNGTQNTK